MKNITDYKSYGWSRVRNDIMRRFDRPGRRDARLIAQDLQAFEKSGNIGDSKFYFINDFIMELETNPEFDAVFLEKRDRIVRHEETFFSDFYRAHVPGSGWQEATYYFSSRIWIPGSNQDRDGFQKLVCEVQIRRDMRSFLLRILRIKDSLNEIPQFWNIHDVTAWKRLTLSDIHLPIFGYLVPKKMSVRDVIDDIEHPFVKEFTIFGTAKTIIYPQESSLLHGHLDFDFLLSGFFPVSNRNAPANTRDMDGALLDCRELDADQARWFEQRASIKSIKFEIVRDRNICDSIKELFNLHFPENLL